MMYLSEQRKYVQEQIDKNSPEDACSKWKGHFEKLLGNEPVVAEATTAGS